MPPTIRSTGKHFHPKHKDCPTRHVLIDEPSLDKPIKMDIYHHSQNHPEKNLSLDLAKTHHNLKLAENHLRNVAHAVANQNFVYADITFVISQGDRTNDSHKRISLSFPIKVPGGNPKSVYSFTNACLDVKQDLENDPRGRPYRSTGDGKAETYALMQDIFSRGKAVLGPDTCGNQNPQFRGGRGYAQAIRHSEQWLICYLNTREAVRALVNRLTTEIRAKDLALIGSTIKVYGVGLSMHSTKTACGVCEVSLVGLQNTNTHHRGQMKGFLEMLTEELLARKTEPTAIRPVPSTLAYTVPGQNKPERVAAKRGLTMFSSYSANQSDSTHQTVVIGTHKGIRMQNSGTRKRIYSANYGGEEFSEKVLKENLPNLCDRTGFVSGSDEPGTPTHKTRKASTKLQDQENEPLGLEDIFAAMTV